MVSGGDASGSPLSALNACNRLSPSAPTTHTIAFERPSLVVTIGEPARATEPHQAVSIAGRRIDANFERNQTRGRSPGWTTRAIALQNTSVPSAPLQTAGDVMATFVATTALAKRAAHAAEVVAVEKIGLAAFPDGQDQLPDAVRAGDVERDRRGPAEVQVAAVEVAPVRGAK